MKNEKNVATPAEPIVLLTKAECDIALRWLDVTRLYAFAESEDDELAEKLNRPAAVSPSDATGKADADELAFNATRLRNVARLVGLESAVPQDDATLDGARGSVLGLIAGKLRTAAATGKADAASAGGLYSPEAVDMLNRLQMRLTAMLGDEFHNVESMLERICSILAAPAFPEKIEMFRLGDTLQVRREKRTDGRSGWLLYDETDRLVSALSRSECGLIDAAIAAQMANIPPATSAADVEHLRQLKHEVCMMYQALDDGEWAEHVAVTPEGQCLETAITKLVGKVAATSAADAMDAERECQYPHESAECKGCGWTEGAAIAASRQGGEA